MASQILCTFLSAILSCAGLTASQTQTNPAGSMRSRIQALGPDSLVEVRLSDGSRLRGWIGTISENAFDLRLGKVKLESRTFGFDQVQSAKPVKSVKPSHTARNILIGVGIGLAAVAVGTVIALHRSGWI